MNQMAQISFANIDEYVGSEIGISEWISIEQARVDMFADATGDHQWIHVDVERAKRESPFRAPVAHGYLSLALVAALSMQAGAIPADAAAAMNYGLDKVRFLAPVPVGSRVRLRVSLLGVERKNAGQLVMKTHNILEIEGSEKPALVAETLAFIVASTKA
jgi:acyl dehydratase